MRPTLNAGVTESLFPQPDFLRGHTLAVRTHTEFHQIAFLQIGKINVNEFSTYVAVNRAIANTAIERLSKGRIKGKSVRVRLLNEEVSHR